MLPAIALRPAQDPPQDIAAALVAGNGSIGQGECQSANMIGDDAIGGVLQIIQLAGVCRRARDLLDGIEDRREHIRIVVAVSCPESPP